MSIFSKTLSLLTLEAYTSVERNGKIGEMSVQYNPASIKLGYETEFATRDAINKRALANQYVGRRPGSLSLDLVFGDTVIAGEKYVQQAVELLRNLCSGIDPKSGEQTFLKLHWGSLKWGGSSYFAGRMSSMSVAYTKFDRDGTPLRASVSLQLIADLNIKFEPLSPITLPQNAVVSVQDMSTLAMMAAAVGMAGASLGMAVIDLAITNDLDTLGNPLAGENLLVER